MEKPNFIRKNGRIIPIMSKEEREKRRTKQDAGVGLATGLAQSLLFKRKNLAIATGGASALHGLSTSISRIKDHGVKKGVWEDMKAGVIKAGANVAGTVIGLGALSKLNHLNKIRKADKFFKSTRIAK